MSDVDGSISRLYRQVRMMLGLGKVTGSSDAGVAQNVQYQTQMEVRSNTPRMAEFGFSSGLPVGTDVVLAFLGGDRSNAVIIGSNHQGFRHTGLADGETVIYDQWGQYVKLTEAGIVVEAQGQPVTVNNATVVTINAATEIQMNTPVLKVSGDIIDNSASNTTTLKTLRETYNTHNHQVEHVHSGDSTLTSKAPGELVE